MKTTIQLAEKEIEQAIIEYLDRKGWRVLTNKVADVEFTAITMSIKPRTLRKPAAGDSREPSEAYADCEVESKD